MATYTAPTGRRLKLRDVVTLIATNEYDPWLTPTFEFTPTQLDDVENHDGDYTDYGAGNGLIALFNEPYDLTNICWMGRDMQQSNQWSNDTTNGLDGTWTSTSFGYYPGLSSQLAGVIRANTNTVSLSGVRGIRSRCNDLGIHQINLYGEKSTLSGLSVWHPTLDQAIDWTTVDTGDVVDTDVNDIAFRVKNLGASARTNVTVGIEERNPILGFDDMHTVDVAGGGFGAFPVNLGTLNAGAISSVVTIRQTIVDTVLGPAWARINITAD